MIRCAIYISHDLKSALLPQIGASSNVTGIDSAWSLIDCAGFIYFFAHARYYTVQKQHQE